MEIIKIHSKRKDYEVRFNTKLVELLNSELESEKEYFVVIDSKLVDKYQKIISSVASKAIIYPLEAGENAKSLSTYEKITNFMLEKCVSKSFTLVAFGGGTIGDLVGYLAATYKRGVNYINIPTTTLAIVDASIGGKNAINMGEIKNALGTIYPPSKILVGTDVLDTLDERNINNGLFESLKMGLSLDKELFELFENAEEKKYLNEVIYRSILAKKEVVEKDEDEISYRKILNFGHTFGHAIEMLTEGKLLHGEAIANGMLIVSKNKEYYSTLVDIITRLNCPIVSSFDIEKVISKIKNDKKIDKGNLDLITVPEVGKAEIKNITLDELRKVVC